jgi:hypothetical protein
MHHQLSPGFGADRQAVKVIQVFGTEVADYEVAYADYWTYFNHYG